ncbi:MAG TPA: TonB-dependent receptor [Vicinamibacterales bacterium]|nr:TonB-dependent receptor [Vicinamibacterales bacterium]
MITGSSGCALPRTLRSFVLLLILFPAVASAQSATVTGAILDQLGARLPGATVTLVGEQRDAGNATSGSDGSYSIANVAPGRYRVRAELSGFETTVTAPFYVGSGTATVNLSMSVGPLQQAVVVTASAAEVSQAQTGAPVTVIDQQILDAINKTDVLEALRLTPGTNIQQTGGRGGVTSIFLRGGNSNFTKVLVDGISINDIGGGVDLAQLQTAGVGRVEVLRQSNSVIYGSDALTGVVSIGTRRGRTRVPELNYTLDGGNFGTVHNDIAVGGAVKRVDYFSDYSFFDTDNEVPNNAYRNHTFAGRFGVALGAGTDLSGTIRHIDAKYANPNAFDLFQIADDSSQKNRLSFGSLAASSQWTNRVQSSVRFGLSDQTYDSVNPTGTGTYVDPFGFGGNYLGNVVTVTGANGYSVTGRGILDYAFSPFPSTYDTRTTRKTLSGQATVQVATSFQVSGGARYEREQGYDDPEGDATATRNNGGAFVEGRAGVGERLYVNAGVGVEHNEAFKTAVTPRVSVAAYLHQATRGAVGATKLTFNAGKGIKAPSLSQERSSLYLVLQSAPAATRATVDPIGPERSVSVDVGVEQEFAGGQARVRVSYFHNDFDDLIEYVSRAILPRLGVSAEAAAASGFGAYVNSQSFKAQGVETTFEAAVARSLRVMASYTYLDAEVTKSLSGGVLSPAVNPKFPGIQIGQYAPLVGARPFRRPRHSGSFLVAYSKGPADVALSAFISGRRDGSTVLDDEVFGYSLLLPNKDLEAGYQKVDLSAGYRVHKHLRGFVSLENLFDKDYDASFGFPALGLTARAGVTVSLGGD